MPDPEQVLSRPAPAPPRTLRYAAGDTGVIDVWDAPGAGATVALVHGGFWKAEYDRLHIRPLANALAAQHLSVASVEYARVGMPGGGWPGTVDSVFAALGAVTADDRLGEVPVVAVGHSAGGHLVALAGSAGGVDGLAGVVPLAGVLDLALAATLDLGDGAAHALMGDASGDEAWNAADPTRRRLTVPAIAIHGDADDVVPVRLAHSWLAARADREPPARLVELPGIGHYELIDPEHPAFAELLRAVRELSSRR